jgi:DNA-binding transcriptional LysR family regulator
MTRSVLVDLDAVLSIARLGSFRAAALELGISTTALSNAVAKLEKRLAIRLFNRTTRSVSLTDAGKTFVERVGPAMTDIHDAMLTAQSLQEIPTGTLRINAFASAAREVMEPLIFSFLQRYTQVHVDLVTEGKLVDIVAAGYDLGPEDDGPGAERHDRGATWSQSQQCCCCIAGVSAHPRHADRPRRPLPVSVHSRPSSQPRIVSLEI